MAHVEVGGSENLMVICAHQGQCVSPTVISRVELTQLGNDDRFIQSEWRFQRIDWTRAAPLPVLRP